MRFPRDYKIASWSLSRSLSLFPILPVLLPLPPPPAHFFLPRNLKKKKKESLKRRGLETANKLILLRRRKVGRVSNMPSLERS